MPDPHDPAMFKTIGIITSLVSLVIVPIRPNNTTAAQAVVVTGMTTAERRATDEALSLFGQAGLPLPLLEIRRHHDLDSCNGSEGLHRRFGERSIIDICTVETGGYEQRTLLHELGHAWSEHFLNSDHKRAFQDLRGWTSWLDYKRAKWEDNGAEQAAEIIAWALSPHPIGVVKIHPNSCKDLHDGYVALTGREPLNGYTKLCKPSVSTSNRS
jgi:hypothetical protein